MTAAIQATDAPIYSVEVGCTLDMLSGAGELFMQWVEEEGRENMASIRQWCEQTARKVQSGGFVLVLARDVYGQPIGMLEFGMEVEPSIGSMIGYVDHAFVVPAWRNLRVFRSMIAKAEELAEVFGITHHVVSCGYGSVLRRYYERIGFRATDIVMKREVTA